MNTAILGFIVLLWTVPPNSPRLLGVPPPIAGIECVPVLVQGAEPFPRMYEQEPDGSWVLVPDTRPYAAALTYCADRLNIYTAWTAQTHACPDAATGALASGERGC